MQASGGSKRALVWGIRLWGLVLVGVLVYAIPRVTERLEAPRIGLAASASPEQAAMLEKMQRASDPIEPVEFSVLEGQLQEEIEASLDEVNALYDERERMPEEERCHIAAGPDAPTVAMFLDEQLKYRLTIASWYHDHGRDEGEGKREGEKFLVEYAKYAVSVPGALGAADLRKMADSAVKAGASEPIFRLYYGRILADCDQIPQAKQIFAEVRNLICHDKYPVLAQFQSVTWPLETPFGINELTREQSERTLIEAGVTYLRDETATRNPRILFLTARSLFTGRLRKSKKTFLESLIPTKKIDPWIRHMFVAAYYRDLAWDARGCGWGSEVTEEGARGFREYLTVAAAHYRRAWQIHPEYPEPASDLIDIAKTGVERRWTAREWFYEATRAQFDYYPAYRIMRGTLLPRWGGSHAEMLLFASECVDTDRWDTYVPNQVIDTLFAIQQEYSGPDEFARIPDVGALVKTYGRRLLKATEADPGIQGNYAGIWAYLAATLVRAGEYPLAREIFEKHGGDIRQSHLDWADMKLATVRGLAYAHTGPAGDVITEVEQGLAQAGSSTTPDEFKVLREKLDQARTLDSVPELQEHLTDLATEIDQLGRFYAGETVELTLDETLAGWYARAEVRQEADQAVQVSCLEKAPGIQLRPLANFSIPFELEAEIGPSPDREFHSSNGIVIGLLDNRAVYNLDLMTYMLVSQPGQRLFTLVGGSRGEEAIPSLEKKPFHRLQVKLWADHVQMSVDDTMYRNQAVSPDNVSSRIAIGENLPESRPNSFRCRSIRIRRLTEEPPEMPAPHLADESPSVQL